MCGIAGILKFDSERVVEEEIKQLTDAVTHRGLDGEGVWIAPKRKIGLGHRRLSILDRSEKGAQPMQYAYGRFTIVYNGEIFNFAELRQELKTKGYLFNSDSDTEVLLASYNEWGKECLFKFNGFWAFALWDELEQELWLTRDRFGIKPLYYLLQQGKQLIFGSETKLFKKIRGFTREADNTLVSYNIQSPWGIEGLGKTIYKEIEQIRPGHYMVVKPDGQVLQKQWWSTADHLVSIPSSYQAQVEKFKEIFVDAIKIRLRSDVNIASALSGGLDSSSVFSQINLFRKTKEKIYRLPQEWQTPFVAVFPGTEQDEQPYADAVLKHCDSDAIYVNCNTGKDLPLKLISSICFHDSISATPLFMMDDLYRSMQENQITVSLDGHGVDEMMYGYAFNVLNAYGNERQNKDYAKQLRKIYLDMINEDEREDFLHKMKFINRLMGFIDRKTSIITNTVYSRDKKSWFDTEIKKSVQLPVAKVPGNFLGAEAQLYHDFHYTTLPTILRNFDLGAMRSGVEIRMPFLDYRLVTYVFSLPMESKLGGGFTKRILRDAMRELLPDMVRTRRLKTGFNAPLKSWFQGELKELLLDEVCTSVFVNSSIWNGKVIRDYVITKTRDESWTMQEAMKFWPVMNAHMLLKN